MLFVWLFAVAKCTQGSYLLIHLLLKIQVDLHFKHSLSLRFDAVMSAFNEPLTGSSALV